MTSLYRAMSSGRRINSAADDAAGLAISEKMKLQSADYARRNANARDEQNQLNIQDGKLATTTSALQRMRELGLQASNGAYGAQYNSLSHQINARDIANKNITDSLTL